MCCVKEQDYERRTSRSVSGLPEDARFVPVLVGAGPRLMVPV